MSGHVTCRGRMSDSIRVLSDVVLMVAHARHGCKACLALSAVTWAVGMMRLGCKAATHWCSSDGVLWDVYGSCTVVTPAAGRCGVSDTPAKYPRPAETYVLNIIALCHLQTVS